MIYLHKLLPLISIASGVGGFPCSYGNVLAPMVDNYSQLFCSPIVITSHNSAVHMAGSGETVPAKGSERVWLLRCSCCVEWDAFTHLSMVALSMWSGEIRIVSLLVLMF